MSTPYYDSRGRTTPQPQQSLSGLFRVLLLLLLIVALGVWWFWRRGDSGVDTNAVPRPVTPRGELADIEKSTIGIFKQASPSVVHITTLALRQDLWSFDVQQIPQGTGSGFIWDEDGHVVTNYHVIQGASAAKVILSDGSSYSADLVGDHADKDLAVLSINAPKSKLRKIEIGTSHDLQVGQMTYAIGNPFGLDQTLTTGIVSALGREITSVTKRPIKNVIQTDAAINPGNSGGPLLDSAGRLIGVNAAIYSPSGASSGIGFAIPVDEVNRIVPQLIRHRKVVRPVLGINAASEQVVQRLRRQRVLSREGVLIWSLEPGGAAAQANLRPTNPRDAQLGDLIVAVDGKPVKSVNDLYSILDEHQVGDTVTVSVLRDDEKQEVQVTLQASS